MKLGIIRSYMRRLFCRHGRYYWHGRAKKCCYCHKVVGRK